MTHDTPARVAMQGYGAPEQHLLLAKKDEVIRTASLQITQQMLQQSIEAEVTAQLGEAYAPRGDSLTSWPTTDPAAVPIDRAIEIFLSGRQGERGECSSDVGDEPPAGVARDVDHIASVSHRRSDDLAHRCLDFDAWSGHPSQLHVSGMVGLVETRCQHVEHLGCIVDCVIREDAGRDPLLGDPTGYERQRRADGPRQR